jgi:hypothetical protein
MQRSASTSVGALRYQIRLLPDDEFDALLSQCGHAPDDGVRAFTCYESQLIAIRDRLQPDRKRELLIHELTHAAIEDSGFIQDERTEALISAIAPRLSALLPDISRLCLELSI